MVLEDDGQTVAWPQPDGFLLRLPLWVAEDDDMVDRLLTYAEPLKAAMKDAGMT